MYFMQKSRRHRQEKLFIYIKFVLEFDEKNVKTFS